MIGRRGSVTRLDSDYMKKYEAHVERKKRRKNRLFRRLAFFGVAVLITFGVMTTYHVKQRSVHADKQAEYEQLQKDYEHQLQIENDLQEEVALLKDPEYVLEIARTNYFFSKEGEMIFKIPDEDPSY